MHVPTMGLNLKPLLMKTYLPKACVATLLLWVLVLEEESVTQIIVQGWGEGMGL